jgi:Ca-activated chloride channel family protein
MKTTAVVSRTLTLSMLLLAGCSQPSRLETPVPVADTAPITPPPVVVAEVRPVPAPEPASAPVERASAPKKAIAAPPVAAPSEQRVQSVQITGSAIQRVQMESAMPVQVMGRSAIAGYASRDKAMANMAPPPPSSMDRFANKEANGVMLVEEHPVSTFSVDVDTASYAFMRRQLAAGRMPPSDSVRIEEMVNYFPYKYATPSSRDKPFGVTTEVMPSPWNAKNQLIHIAVRGYDIQAAQRPVANVVLLVDVSGSMGPEDRLPLLKQGFRMFAAQLRDDDRVSIVTYANGTGVVLEPTTGKDKHKIIAAIDALGSGGGTAGGAGLELAYAQAQRNFDPKAINRVILATDGDFNIGISDPKELEKFIAEKRKTGVYLSIFGVGEGNLNDDLIQRLAQSGNGNAAYIDSLLEARKAMSEELGSTLFPIANDVKIQVEFNPEQVAAYRLIGYETRMLQRQDFKNDKVDAGDMGAGHSVTAIYEITPADAAGGVVDQMRYKRMKYDRNASYKSHSQTDELGFVKLRYKLPGEATSRQTEHVLYAASARASIDAVPDEQRFAVAVAAFGQRLRGEKEVSDFSYADIAKLANGSRAADTQGYRAEFVRLVRMAESLQQSGQVGQH